MSSERQAINKNTPWWGEHLHRYKEVLKRLNGDEKILDLACGTGFGSHVLAHNTSAHVIGGDLSSEAIDQCKKHWTKDNLDFQELNGTQLSFSSSTFDLIISFETIEHTEEFNQMLVEFKRVLKPEGKIFLSTPNKKINSPDGVIINPFHTQEWHYEEFYRILQLHFKAFKFYGQYYNRYRSRRSLALYLEQFFYLRGIRKTPLFIKDFIFKSLGYKSFYPLWSDFSLVSDESKIRDCKTFFAICSI